MNGKKGCIGINIPSVTTPETGKKSCGRGGISYTGWIWNVWELCKEDSNRVIFSFKVGLSVLLVSLLILFRAPYNLFGTNIIWSILTVAIMFEYTVGATFNKGFNRALGSLLAGILAIAVAQLGLCSGRVAEPIIIGVSIFLIGTVTSFIKLLPALAAYEYGFRVVLFTFCLIIISGYRMGNPLKTSMDRLYSIALGGIVAVLVNVLIFPIWAGEQLHEELVKGFNSVADSLQECVGKYLEDDGSSYTEEFTKTVMDDFPDEPAYKRCRTTLNSSAKLESWSVAAQWEPPHGRFRHFFYPWSEYVKVGAVLRHCAYEVMALHGVLHSEIQASYNLRYTFQLEIQEATNDAAELVRSLGKDISDMKRSLKTSLLKRERVHNSTERLQRAIDMHSYLLTSNCEPPAPDNSSKPLPRLSPAPSANLDDLSNQLAELNRTSFDQTSNLLSTQTTTSGSLVAAQVVAAQVESYHEIMRKQSRRLHYSWPPSREVDAFEEEGGLSMDLPRMKPLESTKALSLATFTSLLIEFVARLEHLVDAVDELSKKARFKLERV